MNQRTWADAPAFGNTVPINPNACKAEITSRYQARPASEFFFLKSHPCTFTLRSELKNQGEIEVSSSLYQGAFASLKSTAAEHFELVGDVLIVESIARAEIKTKSGLILDGGDVKKIDGLDMNRPTFVRVLLVGNGFYDETSNADVPLSVVEGDIILIGPMSVKWLSTFGPLISKGETQIGITRESEIQLRFKGQQGYEACYAALQGGPADETK